MSRGSRVDGFQTIFRICYCENDLEVIEDILRKNYFYDPSSIVVSSAFRPSDRVKDSGKAYRRVDVCFTGRAKTPDELALDRMRDLC